MDQLTCDLDGVAVYLDDILISGSSADEHLQNLRALLQHLQDRPAMSFREVLIRSVFGGVLEAHSVQSGDFKKF